jgi:hypothetical protein
MAGAFNTSVHILLYFMSKKECAHHYVYSGVGYGILIVLWPIALATVAQPLALAIVFTLGAGCGTDYGEDEKYKA